jgi:hypothetical protein
MSATGGSFQQVSIGGRLFAVAADADVTKKLGGFTAEVQPNGDSSARLILTRAAWEIAGLNLSLDNDRGDHEYLQNLIDNKRFVDISATEASQVTWQGTGTVTGDLVASSMSATVAVTLGGPGKLTQQ